jgi:glycoside hydrolase-like protein
MRPARLRTPLAATLTTLLAITLVGSSGDVAGAEAPAAEAPAAAAVAAARNPVTPGNFRGYGFDQCLAPTQAKMNSWLQHSPFLAVGIYISGDSRACRHQPNLTPRWISTQLSKGWRLLPITLGPQASCQPRFPRYRDDFKISPAPGGANRYPTARRMGVAEAIKTVKDAKALGIVEGSTLWYDLEGFDVTNRHCRESALAFLSTWTQQLHKLNYVSGVYSSAGSGIKALDDARVNRPNAFKLPDRIWIARWDGMANTSTSYIREDGWRPGRRVKQYQGGHDEVWGGVRINIDRNYLDLGNGSKAPPETHCNGVNVNFTQYQALHPPAGDTVPPPSKVRALQCLLKEKGVFGGKVSGIYNRATITAVRAWQTGRGFKASDNWSRRDWITLHTHGNNPVLKVGSMGGYVRRVQRALNAANPANKLTVSGVYDGRTSIAMRAYQTKLRLGGSGVTNFVTWPKLKAGRY